MCRQNTKGYRLNYKIKQPADIPGWTSSEQHKIYKSIVKQLPKNPKVLEIGCGWGRSTSAWLNVLPENTEFYVLDKFCLPTKTHFPILKKDYNKLNKPHIENFVIECLNKNLTQYEIFLFCMRQHSNFEKIKNIYVKDYYDWKKENTIKFDLVYLDGDHTYNHVKDQLEYFKDVPIVCGDDYKPERKHHFEGLIKAVDEYRKTYNVKHELYPQSHIGFYVFYNK